MENKKTLATVMGTAIGAALLFVSVPREESGRTVQATTKPDGSVAVKHISGKQYLKVYLDVVGVPTACDGITKGMKLGQVYTEAQCAAFLEEELIAHAEPVMKCIPSLKGRDYQAPAVVDLAFNVGPGGVCRSSLVRLGAAQDWRRLCNKLLEFNRAGGRVLRGLTLRRRRAWEVCVTNILPGKTPATLEARVKAVR